MQIITPNYILTPDELLSNVSVAFGTTIQKIAPLDELIKEFPDAKITTLEKNSLLMPGLINAHVHLEFSANRTELSYGNFIKWLHSVIEHRDELISGCANECMTAAINSMLESGITTFGAVSSYGMDLDACFNAPQNVIYFNEVIGSQATMADILFNNFLARLDTSKASAREGFYPAVAIHSPYSVHPILIKKALQIVKDEKLKLSAHFMESEAERNWLDKNEGEFKEFFETLLKQNSSISDSQEFLKNFKDEPMLLTHAVKANYQELDEISKSKHTIIHCPISNRLLGNGALDLSKLDEKNIRWICATDGLSSNYRLNLFEEMKCALFMHSNMPLKELTKKLILSVTKDASDALGLNCGEIKEGKNADMIVINLESEPSNELELHLILQGYNVEKVYINGKLKKGQ
ncbi:metal-dependent hydrolase [Sulfurimonas sp.]|uniref:aminofutalosine deaminase family hydrolase n=1 Tax=Sulfurimonas sp. TaxID=2022749 RepID=UPI0025E050C8|nr:metal-dependent hydrolase [Sulfurimonas sp.]MDD5158291.1 metal-dependent hydrolase [Sulfurimonas sp.]